ncbi:hypothetical protein FNF28_07775 [Cafeteria roenbergensis]|uniref:Cadherin domain-containing protein n=1 Tax=Cafeteria roenbergensis TaxID=33653 RepID=A0A5A8BZ68_CAFRO|nr:hypothetical protein FNF28_07775 [Cafeteria roenbergensis]
MSTRPPLWREHTVVVAENSPIGFAIEGTASRARDVDADDVLSYAIVSQSPGSFFRMLSADGAVEVRQAGIDFETSAKHSLLVRVTDKAGLSAESQLHISVADVNEAPVIADQRRSVPENSPSTSCGLPLVAADVDAKDTPYSLPFAFSIVSSSAPGAFAIDPTSGVLSTTAAAELDHEAAPEAVVRVRVTDSSGATGEAAINVLVTDVNEAPTFAHKSYSFQVAENANFQEEVDIVSAADPDKADTLRFTLRVDSAPEGGQASDLGINPSTGKVFVARKTAAAVATPSEYLPQGGVYTCTATAQDNGIASTLVATIEGSDNDQDDELSYSILDGNYADTFKLTTVASASGHNYAELRVARPIVDFEDRTSYSLVVQVSDGFLKASTVVTVTVVDVNERPIIDAASLTLTVDENPASVGGVVGTVAARDVDADDLLTFAFFGDGNKAGHFAIDASTGAVSVASLDIDRETTSSYSIGVRVSDAGGLVDERQLSVLVNDVNDAPALADVVLQVPENLAPGAQVSSPLRVVDDDARDRHTFKMGRPNCWASQASTIGKYYFAPLALYKAPTGFFYQLTVGALNNAHSTIEKCSPSCFQVASAPTPAALSTREFRSFWFSVSSQGLVTLGRGESEQLSEGLLVSFQDGADAAHGPALLPTRVGVAAASSALQFSSLCFDTAQSSAEGVFAVVEDGSVRIAAASPDFEAQREFGFEVLVTDSGAPAKQAAGVVMVQVQDVNERVTWATSSCLPGLAQAFAACLTVAENTLPAQRPPVLQSIAGMATDPDTLAKQALTFSVALDGNSLRVLNGTAGDLNFESLEKSRYQLVLEVRDEASLNFEAKPAYTLTLQARDDVQPTPLTATATVTISLVDANDAPSIVVPPGGYVLQVEELAPVGTVLVSASGLVDRITATDEDVASATADWARLRWSLKSGNSLGIFDIDAVTGQVSVADFGRMDFENKDTERLQPGGPGNTLSEAKLVAGQQLGLDLVASDPDGPSDEAKLRWRIESGDSLGFFSIFEAGRAGSLVLTAAGAMGLNHEVVDSYTLVVSVTDAGGLSDTATVAVEVADLNERPILAAATFSINETSPRLSVVAGSASLATDEDADDSHTYEVVNQVPAGVFRVANARTGQLEVDEAALDFEAVQSHRITMPPSRVAESPTSEPVRLDFEGKNLFALTILSGDRCSSGAKVIKIDASTGVLSMVALGTCTQTYDPSTPQFKPNDVDFDNKFDLMIRITDSHLASTVNHLVIKLSGSNGRPRFVSRTEPFLLDENSAVGTLVGTVFAVDQNYQKQSLEYAVGPRGANVNRPFPFKMVTREATEQDRMALAQSDAGASVQLRQVGEILVDGPIDFEGEFSTYKMVVVLPLTPTATCPLTGSMDVTVGVVNLNEPPTFVDGAVGGSAMFVVTVPENSVLGTALAGDKLVATDVDSADQGSVLRYSLEGEQAGWTSSSFGALPADVAGGVAWDVDVDLATAAVPNMYNGKVVDWRVTHGTMDALSVTAGGARLVISGTNLGKTAARIAREKAASLDPPATPRTRFRR